MACIRCCIHAFYWILFPPPSPSPSSSSSILYSTLSPALTRKIVPVPEYPPPPFALLLSSPQTTTFTQLLAPLGEKLPLLQPESLAAVLCGGASLACLLIALFGSSDHWLGLASLLGFEFCVGAYYPAIGHLRGKHVPYESRYYYYISTTCATGGCMQNTLIVLMYLLLCTSSPISSSVNRNPGLQRPISPKPSLRCWCSPCSLLWPPRPPSCSLHVPSCSRALSQCSSMPNQTSRPTLRRWNKVTRRTRRTKKKEVKCGIGESADALVLSKRLISDAFGWMPLWQCGNSGA